ncbi:hypothetical protein SAMN05444274_102132 [Mariniphaga anaerophila]|uniref:O-Antigen ligase n=1 Tax=Mariniphaga anaerophila TaxID=1484053 RepID=A0A1M4VL13_9BACT|nr:hypothetical protein [Mariniphaga anaerophila]SHE69598.1 hypothetical protein SAMN05444274_102132 [Mariniphaga anaerophila]
MDILLLLIGIGCLFFNKQHLVIAIIIILASSYLQLALENGGLSTFPFPHNVSDSGLVLYFLFFISILVKNSLRVLKSPVLPFIGWFLLFLLISSCIDIFINHYTIGDVIRQLRHWLYLSIILIGKYIGKDTIKKAINTIIWVTILMCLVLSFQHITGIHLIGASRIYNMDGTIINRGVKPPVYVISAIMLLFGNYNNKNKKIRIVLIFILFLPVILSLKISYTVAIILGCAFIALRLKISLKKLAYTSAVVAVLALGIFYSSPVLKTRFLETTQQTQGIKQGEVDGNFSYRILHFYERLIYCIQKPQTAVFGIGSVSEQNFNKTVFALGQPDQTTGKMAQLNTADIAWSILILRLGALGIIVFLFFYIKTYRQLKKYAKNDKLSLVLASYMLMNLLFLSFGNAIIAYSDFFILPLLYSSANNQNSLKNYKL